jgi:deoxyribodipyrimidine photo-lyase|uniref:cryptochrome/photolyase family protein n=2 Tax=Candidatus Planktophila sp. TaxID=2175601 RepID=UPI00404B211A
MSVRNIVWFRRDLRVGDHPALNAAIVGSDEIVPVFILDKAQIAEAGEKLLAYMGQSLRALDESLGNCLHIIEGDQVEVLKELIEMYGVSEVHISDEYERYGAARDARVEAAGIKLVRTGSPYAVAPGRVVKPSDATPYRVYTPFYRAWCTHGWRAPARTPAKIPAVTPPAKYRAFPDFPMPAGVNVITAGEKAALTRFKQFTKKGLDSYDENRNFASIDGTSKMSTYLKFGEIHPRTLLAGLGESKAHDTFRKEIAWREFYADVLFNNPDTDTEYYAKQFKAMRYDKPGKQFQAWCEGKTGYPFVDAAMRQLVLEGWMHNRTRMVVASFLVKDLHLEWQLGERFFAQHLVDYDVASNAHGWQWTAGTGTDASPYYRVFNPIEQGRRFDENGDYIRKYVAELAHLSAAEIHEPWLFLDGYSHDYPERIVDHALERVESLERLKEIKADKPEQPLVKKK